MNPGIIPPPKRFASTPYGLLGLPTPIPVPLPSWPFESNNITSGLVGWWKLDETSGTTASDSSGTGMTGTLGGGLSFSGAKGILGNCLTGMNTSASRWITVPNNAAQNFSADFTIATWVKTTGLFNFYKNSSNGPDQYEFSMRGSAFNGLYFRGNGLDTILADNRLSLLQNNEWHHLCATRLGEAINLFIDGIKQRVSGSKNNASFATNTLNLTIRCDGVLDDVRIYNKALGESQVNQLYYYRTRNDYELP